MCIGLRDYDVWKLTCCSLSSQLFSSQKLSWEGVLREGSRPFFNRHGATVYMQRYQKCFSHNHERNGRTTLIVNIKRINFVGLHFFQLAYLFFSTPSKIRNTKILFSISWDYISFYFHFFSNQFTNYAVTYNLYSRRSTIIFYHIFWYCHFL